MRAGFATGSWRDAHAFTLVELLIVIAIITVLLGLVVAVSTAVINKSKAQNTLSVLAIVRDAVTEFQREQSARPGIVLAEQGDPPDVVRYLGRYGYFPPDELEVFTDAGLPGSDPPGGTLAVGGAIMVPAPAGGYGPMQFRRDGLSLAERASEHRDLAALIVAIELYGASSAELLGGIPDRYRSAGSLDADGLPNQFLDRDGSEDWDPDDLQIRYILDDWGVPISYLAQRDYDPTAPPPAPPTISSNHDDWNQASTEMIRLNGGQPIIMSYGADGRDQLTLQWMEGTGAASLVADWMDGDPATPRINHPLNEDNVYADAALKRKLAEGIER